MANGPANWGLQTRILFCHKKEGSIDMHYSRKTLENMMLVEKVRPKRTSSHMRCPTEKESRLWMPGARGRGNGEGLLTDMDSAMA